METPQNISNNNTRQQKQLTIAPHSEEAVLWCQGACQDDLIGVDQQLEVSVYNHSKRLCLTPVKKSLERETHHKQQKPQAPKLQN